MSIKEYKIVKKFNYGESSVEKYIVEKNNKLYLLRLYDIRFMSSRYKAFKNITTLIENKISVPKIYDFGEDGIHGYAIVEWIDGESLDKLLINDNLILEYGKKVAKELLKMHHIVTNEKENIYENFINTFNKKLKKVNELGIDFDLSIIKAFVLNNCKILKECDTSIIHGDLHPGNIVVNNNEIYFIDLDVCKNDFAWIDLSTNACNMDYPKFYTILINEYFDGKINENFWLIYNLYGSLYCLDYILYCDRMNNKTVDEGILKTKKFLEYNESFNSLESKWFDKKIIGRENKNERVKKI